MRRSSGRVCQCVAVMRRTSIRGAAFRAAGMLVCVVALAACTIAVPGQASRMGTSLGLPPVPVIPEEPARWAMSELDPCALTRDLPLDTAQGFYAIRPHSCAADYAPPGATEWSESSLSGDLFTRVGGQIVDLPRLVVHVGARFDVTDRSKMAKVDFGGRTAYQAYGKDFPAPEINYSSDYVLCRIDFPISADHSIQIVSSAPRDVDLNTGCAAPRTVAEAVAAKLSSPATLVRTSPAGLGRWNACDLLEQATGYLAKEPGRNADECYAYGPGADLQSKPTLELDTIAGRPDLLEPSEYTSETSIDLPPFGAAVQRKISDDQCELRFAVERQPDVPPKYVTQVMSVKLAGSPGDPCAGAADAATKIHNIRSGPAPQPPPAPAHLGFAVGEPDAEMPAACGVFTGMAPDFCRAPRPVSMPATAQDVLRVSETLSAPDMSCAVLRDAVAPVVGDAIELAALMNQSGGGCIGLTNDAYEVYLGFFAHAAAGEYCMGVEKQEVQIAGRPAVQCAPGERDFSLYLPTTTPEARGVALVEARLVAPRGDMSWSSAGPDPAATVRMSEGTTRIAENVIRQRLSG
jgi:hypothetical protein